MWIVDALTRLAFSPFLNDLQREVMFYRRVKISGGIRV